MNARPLVVLLVGGALLLNACAGAPPPEQLPAASFLPAATPAPRPAATAPPASEAAALDFAIETVGGGRFVLSEQRGKVVGLFVMASWCASCVAEAAAWGRLQRELRAAGLEVLVVSADPLDTEAELRQFSAWANAPELTWAVDRRSELVQKLEVRSLDTTVVFDRRGRVVFRDEVPTPYEVLRREVEQALR